METHSTDGVSKRPSNHSVLYAAEEASGFTRRTTFQGETIHARTKRRNAWADKAAAAAIQAYWVAATGGDLTKVDWSKQSSPRRTPSKHMEYTVHRCEPVSRRRPEPSLDIMLTMYGLSI